MSFRKAIQDNRRAVVLLSSPEMNEVLPTLYDLRTKTAKALAKFLKGEEVGSEYSMHKHRMLILQLDDVIKTAEKELPVATLKELRKGSVSAGRLGISKMQTMVNEGEKQFRGAATPLRIPIVKVLTNVQRTMMGRYEHKSMKYAGDVGRRIRNELAVGVIKGESVGEMTRRLLGGKFEKLSMKGPSAMADGIAEKTYFKNYHEAERLVRTELVNAYTETQIESLHEANDDDPGWKKMWDAANDDRVCDDCDELDGVVVDLNDTFPGGIQGPPLHPNDRCSIVPWHEGWGSPKGVLPGGL